MRERKWKMAGDTLRCFGKSSQALDGKEDARDSLKEMCERSAQAHESKGNRLCDSSRKSLRARRSVPAITRICMLDPRKIGNAGKYRAGMINDHVAVYHRSTNLVKKNRSFKMGRPVREASQNLHA